MPMFNVQPQKELPPKRNVESVEANKKEIEKSDSSENSGRVARNEPASNPWVIGSSIVRRNEPDDAD